MSIGFENIYQTDGNSGSLPNPAINWTSSVFSKNNSVNTHFYLIDITVTILEQRWVVGMRI